MKEEDLFYVRFDRACWHKRLNRFKCMNSYQILLQALNRNVFSGAPWGDGVMTLNLNNKSIYPSFAFFLLTYYLKASATKTLLVREILFMKVTERHLWATH